MTGQSSYHERRHSRLAGYDYMTAGYYFVTVCTHQRTLLFGSIDGGTTSLSPAGIMVREAWRDLLDLHPGVDIDIDIVLPDHAHAIVVLDDDPRRMLSLVDVLHRYKSLTTKRYAHDVQDQSWSRFAGRLWQESFYDHVIRRDGELDAVRRYILENPQRWELQRAAREQAEGR